MEAGVSEPVLPAKCTVLPVSGVNQSSTPTNLATPTPSNVTVIPRTIGPPTPAELEAIGKPYAKLHSSQPNIKQQTNETTKDDGGTSGVAPQTIINIRMPAASH